MYTGTLCPQGTAWAVSGKLLARALCIPCALDFVICLVHVTTPAALIQKVPRRGRAAQAQTV